MTSVLSPSSTVRAGGHSAGAAVSSSTSSSSAAAAALLTSHPFTCNTCQVAFRSSEQQRSHMHTDWHRYNLKRRITSLPPLTSEVFAEKVLHMQATTRLEHERATFEKSCKACNKTYYSENAYTNHVASQKHKQNVAAEKLGIKRREDKGDRDKEDETASIVSSTFSLGTAVEEERSLEENKVNGHRGSMIVEEEDDVEAPVRRSKGRGPAAGGKNIADIVNGMKIASPPSSAAGFSSSLKQASDAKASTSSVAAEAEAEEVQKEPHPLPLEACLFCPYISPSFTLNVSHMFKVHGLYIPEQKYLVDLPGLVRYLGEKVAVYHECLYCGKVKGGIEGVQTHMRDVGHCKIAYETEEDMVEIGEFYDFRETWKGVPGGDEEEDEEKMIIQEVRERRHTRRKSGGGIKSNRKASSAGTEFVLEDGVGGGEDDGGWETDSSASSLDSTELCAVPLDHHHLHSVSGSQDGKDHHHHHHHHVHVHHTPVYHTDYELHLPGGKSVGHRSLARYYRQKLGHPVSDAVRRKEELRERRLGEVRRRLLGIEGPPPLPAEVEDEDEDEDEDVEEVDEFDDDEEAPSTSTTNNRDLTRRERRDLFFGRMSESERDTIVGERPERGMTKRGEVGVAPWRRREVRDDERRARRDEMRLRARRDWRVESVANNQKHYRDMLLQ